MKKDGLINITGSNSKGLCISTKKSAFGLAIKNDLQLARVGLVELEWGIATYPNGASWSKKNNRNALMIHLFFGPKIKADRFYLPDSPYFIGLFLCKDEPLMEPFIGKSYEETGRYVCLDTPETGTMVNSSIHIDRIFQQWFDRHEVPPITGIGIEVDTSGLQDGHAAAFLKTIRLYKRPTKR